MPPSPAAASPPPSAAPAGGSASCPPPPPGPPRPPPLLPAPENRGGRAHVTPRAGSAERQRPPEGGRTRSGPRAPRDVMAPPFATLWPPPRGRRARSCERGRGCRCSRGSRCERAAELKGKPPSPSRTQHLRAGGLAAVGPLELRVKGAA